MGIVTVCPATVVVMVPETAEGAFVAVTVRCKVAVASELTIPVTESVSRKFTWGAERVAEAPAMLEVPDRETT